MEGTLKGQVAFGGPRSSLLHRIGGVLSPLAVERGALVVSVSQRPHRGVFDLLGRGGLMHRTAMWFSYWLRQLGASEVVLLLLLLLLLLHPDHAHITRATGQWTRGRGGCATSVSIAGGLLLLLLGGSTTLLRCSAAHLVCYCSAADLFSPLLFRIRANAADNAASLPLATA